MSAFTRGDGLGQDPSPQPVNAPIATKMENQPKSPDEIEARRLAVIIENLGKQCQAVGINAATRYPEGPMIERYGQAGDFKSAIGVMNALIPKMKRDITIRKTVNSVTTDQAITGLPNGVLVAGGFLAVVGVVAATKRKK